MEKQEELGKALELAASDERERQIAASPNADLRERVDALELALADAGLEWAAGGLQMLSKSSRAAQFRTIASIGALVGVAGIALGAGLVVDNVVFWFGAVSIFFLACTGIVAWAAKTLGVFAELAELYAVHTRTWREKAHEQIEKRAGETGLDTNGPRSALDPPPRE